MKALKLFSLMAVTAMFTGALTLAVSAVTGLEPSTSLGIAAALEIGLGAVSMLSIGAAGLGALAARIQNPIIGQAINQAGGMIFSVWKQLKVMRSKPLSVANPNTPAQAANRRRMALLASTMREILQTLRVGFVRFQNGTTQWAQFIKENYAVATSDNGTVAAIDAEALTFSKGTLLPLQGFGIDSVSGQQIDLTWSPNSGQPGATASDKVYVVLVDANGADVASFGATASRDDGAVSVTAPADITAATCIVYAFCSNAAADDVSDSQIATP